MIKPETTPVIRELKNAGLRTVMVTGDNLLTALNVARKCGMIPLKNKVVLVEAHAGTETENSQHRTPARIEWKLAEPFSDFEDSASYQSMNPVSFSNAFTIKTLQIK